MLGAANDTQSVSIGESLHSSQTSVNILARKCREMVEKAKKDVLAAGENAYKKGYEKGKSEGFKSEYDETTKSVLNANLSQTSEFDELKKRIESEPRTPCENDGIKEKALLLAKKIIENELLKNDDAYFGLYTKAANHISNAQSATLVTSERGADVFEKNKEKYENAIDGLNHLEVKTKACENGLCILETEFGTVDASAEKQFERAKNIMMPQN
jgi:flagellar assembly protein FliH